MLSKNFVWAFTFAFFFPAYGYADGTAVPEFKTVYECQKWVRDYAGDIDVQTLYDADATDWLYSFAVSRSSSYTKCENKDCTTWFYGDEKGPVTGGCDMIGYSGETFFEDAWVIAKRNLDDLVSIYESRLTLLPEYRYGKMCRYQKGTEPLRGDCKIMMHDPNQPCATLNPINNSIHIPCLNDGGTLYWKEADFLEPWTFEVTNEGSGFDVPGHRDDCATYTASTGIIHIPCVKVGEKSYWADFEVLNTVPVRLVLKDFGVN